MQLLESGERSLAEKNFVYEALCTRLAGRFSETPEAELAEIEDIANFAYANHPGRFADGFLENRALTLAGHVARSEQLSFRELKPKISGRPRLLHVASEVFQVGGHTRLLAKWIDRDTVSNHVLVLTRQRKEIPEILAQACARRDAEVLSLPIGASRLTRARTLRAIGSQMDRIILHHHPDDVIPLLAFAEQSRVPVAFFNHAHFWFSLGSAVADITINTLPYFQRLTEKFRFPRKTALLEGVPGNRAHQTVDKGQAKRALGLDDNAPVIITIGSEHYYKPGLDYDFFRTAQKILDTCERVQMIFIGVKAGCNYISKELREHKNVRFLGSISDPVPYYQAADICLESFPMPSLGGFTESVAYGAAYPIPVYGPYESVIRLNNPFAMPDGWRAKDEAEYVQHVHDVLRDLPSTRVVTAELQAQMQRLDQQWPSVLHDLYSHIDVLKHEPGPIPVTQCSFEEDHRVLAQLNPFDLIAALRMRFRFPHASWLHLTAARKGLRSWKQTFSTEIQYSKSAFVRKLGL